MHRIASKIAGQIVLRNSSILVAPAITSLSQMSHHTIATGTDLTKTTKSSWQNAHPWYMDATKGSNMASDNTRSMKDIFSGKKVAVFGVPAPYTGVCTEEHVPGYKTLADDFKGKGVDSIICYAVGCPYAQYAWAKNMDALGKIEFLSDVDGSWAKEFGLDKDYSAVSLGVRSERFSMLVEDGEVKKFQIVEDAKKDASVLLKQA